VAEDQSQDNRHSNGSAEDLAFLAELRVALGSAAAVGALAAASPADDLLARIVRTAAQVISSPEGALFLVDQERRLLTFDVVIGKTAATMRGTSFPLGHGIAGLVAVSRQSIAVANAQDDPRHAKDIAAQSGYFPTTILAVPVTGGDGTVLGVLELLDRQRQPTYDLADMDLLNTFAEQVAIVLDDRRAHTSLAGLVGRALAALGGLPAPVEHLIRERSAGFAAAIGADPITRRTVELAELVATVADGSPAAHDACADILRAFARYGDAASQPGSDLERLL